MTADGSARLCEPDGVAANGKRQLVPRISDHIFQEEQQRIRRERIAAEELLRRYQINHDTILETLDLALNLTNSVQLHESGRVSGSFDLMV